MAEAVASSRAAGVGAGSAPGEEEQE
jgi:hypothetical protein